MNEKEVYKAYYMQNPFNILTQENLDRLEKHCKKAIHYERKEVLLEHQITLDLLYKYRDQQSELENKNKIIDLMADEIDETDRGYIDYCNMKIVCDRNCKNCIKQYYERKVENGN